MMVEEYKSALVVEEQRTMSMEPPQRQMPQSTVQLAAHTSDALIGGMSKSPLMLGVVVLNVIAIAAAVYFLNLLISGQQAHLKSLLDVQSKQQTEIVTLHKAEFDALLEMANRLAIPVSPIAPTSQLLNQPPTPPARDRR